jgi:hypothetical protein
VLARWADAHGWAGILATLHYADQQYDDLPTKPNPVKLIGTLMETAKQEGRPYGTNTRDYTKHKEQQHERQRREHTPKQRKHAVPGADHAVQPVRQPDGARPAVAERPAPHFVQRLRERAQANPSG